MTHSVWQRRWSGSQGCLPPCSGRPDYKMFFVSLPTDFVIRSAFTHLIVFRGPEVETFDHKVLQSFE